MKTIIFENDGEIDLASITTFGVNVKGNDNPIGFFGTGLKYAIAILLRTGHGLEIHSGSEKLKFELREEIVRGKPFKIPFANNQRMAFTSELGKNWELWQAYRELFCNAKDENGKVFQCDSIPSPNSGITRVAVTGNDFSDCHMRRGEYILEDEPDFVLGNVEVRRRPSDYLFFKGIRIMNFPRTAMFTYNILSDLTITEDRTAKCAFTANGKTACAWLNATPDDRSDLIRVLTADKNFQEGNFDFHGWGGVASETFLDAVAECQREGLGFVNQTALRVWREQAGGKFSPKLAEVCPVHRKMLALAISFCGKNGFAVDDYPILIVQDLGGGIQALAADGKIFLTSEVFSRGTKYVARALIEEWAHLRHKHVDCSREFQNWIFDKLIDSLERLSGDPI